MKILPFLLVICIILHSSCASGPPERIENNTYINPKYEFSIDIPEGWRPFKKVPRWIRHRTSLYDSYKIKFSLKRQDSSGFMLIAAEKSNIGPVIFAVNPQKITEDMNKWFSRHKKELEKEGAKNIVYNFSPIQRIKASQEVSELEFDIEKFHVIKRLYTHECDYDGSCLVGFNLMSRPDKWEENIAAYESVVRSIKIGILE